MQKAKVADGGSAAGLFLDRDGLTSGTLFKAKYPNDNFGNLFDLVINAGYTLIDDDLSQITKAVRGGYNATYTYNTASIASQSVNDIVLGNDGSYYECIVNATTGDNPVGSVTGNWRIIPNFELLMNTITINFASNADMTLTTEQNQYGRFVITDTGILLTTTRNVIVGTTQKRFLVQNNTAQSLVFKTSAGTGITVVAGGKADLYCDGTNVIFATETNIAPDASETVKGIIEIASTAESQAGTNDTKAITPLKMKESLNASGSAPMYACRAWVNFNGTGSIAVRASGNVSSITDNGTGDYTINFATALIDANYSTNAIANATASTDSSGGYGMLSSLALPTPSGIRIRTILGGGFADREYISASIFR